MSCLKRALNAWNYSMLGTCDKSSEPLCLPKLWSWLQVEWPLQDIHCSKRHFSGLKPSIRLNGMRCGKSKNIYGGQLFDPDFVSWFKQDILLFWNNYHTQESWNGRFGRDWTLNAIRAYIGHTGFQEYSKHSGGEKADQHKLCKCPLRCSFFN